jgi:hypothetical protein
MFFQLPAGLILSFAVRAWAINIVDFDSCSIPYIIPGSFQRYCDHSDEYLSELALVNLNGEHKTSFTPPANVTSAGIRNKPNIWTHEPFCIESPEANNGFCVYTNANFANGRGISIVATPREIMKLMQASIFKTPDFNFENNAKGADRYEQKEVYGKGLGNVANATFQRGEKLQSFTPLVSFQDNFMQFVDQRQQHLLQRIAVDRLPVSSQDKFMALLGHFGGDPYSDRIQTNSFATFMGDAEVLYPAYDSTTVRYQVIVDLSNL